LMGRSYNGSPVFIVDDGTITAIDTVVGETSQASIDIEMIAFSHLYNLHNSRFPLNLNLKISNSKLKPNAMCNYSQIPGFWGHRIKKLGFVLRETGDLGT
jgi:hypothetical protein